jgi:hypothetical protein
MAELDFTNEPLQEVESDPLVAESVTEKDKFKLAKSILFASLLLYVGVIILFAWSDWLNIKGPAKEIWDFSSQGLFGIINLIIGFYFGGKIGSKSS